MSLGWSALRFPRIVKFSKQVGCKSLVSFRLNISMARNILLPFNRFSHAENKENNKPNKMFKRMFLCLVTC